jgi:hypothetical protein
MSGIPPRLSALSLLPTPYITFFLTLASFINPIHAPDPLSFLQGTHCGEECQKKIDELNGAKDHDCRTFLQKFAEAESGVVVGNPLEWSGDVVGIYKHVADCVYATNGAGEMLQIACRRRMGRVRGGKGEVIR